MKFLEKGIVCLPAVRAHSARVAETALELDTPGHHSIQGADLVVHAVLHEKGFGFLDIPDDVFELAPSIMAKAWHPLITKMSVRIAEPIRLKGGKCTDSDSALLPILMRKG